MSMPKAEIQQEVTQAWNHYLAGLERSLDLVEEGLAEAQSLASVCTGEWCQATEHVIDELGNALFSISEPRWSDPEDSKRLKRLKRKLYDLYVNYRGVYKKAA